MSVLFSGLAVGTLALGTIVIGVALQGRQKSPFENVEAAARSATTNDEASVTKLVDEIFKSSQFATIAPSIRARVLTTELAARRDTREGMSEERLVQALNTALEPLSSLPFARTNQQQLHLFRRLLSNFVPHLVTPAPPGSDVGTPMGPAEACFVAVQLVNQKLMNKDFQVDPETWVNSKQGAPASARPTPLMPEVSFEQVPQVLVQLEDALRSQQGVENSVIVRSIHRFMDDLKW